jgi:hypothetical protein
MPGASERRFREIRLEGASARGVSELEPFAAAAPVRDRCEAHTLAHARAQNRGRAVRRKREKNALVGDRGPAVNQAVPDSDGVDDTSGRRIGGGSLRILGGSLRILGGSLRILGGALRILGCALCILGCPLCMQVIVDSCEERPRAGEAEPDGVMDSSASVRCRYRCSSIITRGLRLRSLSIARI